MTEDDTFAVELIEQGIFSLPWSQKSFADACRNQDNVYLVCEADGVIAGYCGMWTVLGEGNTLGFSHFLLLSHHRFPDKTECTDRAYFRRNLHCADFVLYIHSI